MHVSKTFAQLVSAKIPKIISLIKNVGIIFCNMQFIIAISHIYVKFSLLIVSWRENTAVTYWPSFSGLKCGIQLLIRYSMYLMMLEFILCFLNMQLCSSVGLYWHNFLRLVMLVQNLNRRMNRQLYYLIWLVFQNKTEYYSRITKNYRECNILMRNPLLLNLIQS